MPSLKHWILPLAGLWLLSACRDETPQELTGPDASSRDEHRQSRAVRFATFNASLNRSATGQLITDLSTSGNQQASDVAEVIQRVAPDVLLINEFDFDESHQA